MCPGVGMIWKPGTSSTVSVPPDNDLGARLGVLVFLMDDPLGVKLFRELLRLSHIIPMGQKNISDSTHFRESFGQVGKELGESATNSHLDVG